MIHREVFGANNFKRIILHFIRATRSLMGRKMIHKYK